MKDGAVMGKRDPKAILARCLERKTCALAWRGEDDDCCASFSFRRDNGYIRAVMMFKMMCGSGNQMLKNKICVTLKVLSLKFN